MAFLALCCFSSEDPLASGSDGLRPSGEGSDDDDDWRSINWNRLIASTISRSSYY
jgi:hypothetical protein